VDIDENHIKGCKSFFGAAGLSDRVSCEVLDLTELKEAESFNLILSVDVMEHIKEDELVFRNFCRALKPGGSLLISTPSDKGGSDVHDEGDKSFIEEHVRNGYGIGEISKKLETSGFKRINASYTYGTPGGISWHLSMKYPVEMLGISKLFFLVMPFYYLIIFPVALFLNFLDVSMIHKSGTGLLVIAGK
jgi:SAM-dependent methyltransferase